MNCGVEQGPAVVAFTPSFAPRSDAESLVNTRLVTGLKKAGMRIEVISRRNGAIPKAWSAPGIICPPHGTIRPGHGLERCCAT